jgi:hypothetical protein
MDLRPIRSVTRFALAYGTLGMMLRVRMSFRRE